MGIIEKAISLGKKRDDPPHAATKARPHKPPAGPGTPHGGPRPAPVPYHTTLAAKGILASRDDDPTLFEQLRHLKRPVLQNAFGPLGGGNNAHIVMIASALPGAGKTFTSANLAYSLTHERDRSVVLIDLDNIKRTLTRSLGLEDRPGFFDVIDNPAMRLDEVMLDTDMAGLSVIPTGTHFDDSAELLGCERARRVVAQLAHEDPSRIILLDTPPLLSTPDAHAIVEIAGQLLVVIEAGVTTLSDMKKMLPTLGSDKPVGLVLNKSPASAWLSQYGGDYYGSGYGPS